MTAARSREDTAALKGVVEVMNRQLHYQESWRLSQKIRGNW